MKAGPGEGVPTVWIECAECTFTTKVEKVGEKPAGIIVEHGRETGHKLSIDDPTVDRTRTSRR